MEADLIEMTPSPSGSGTSSLLDESVLMEVDGGEGLDISMTSTQRRMSSKRTKLLKSHPMSKSQNISKAVEMDSAAIPMNKTVEGASKSKAMLKKDFSNVVKPYTLIESSVFLLPVMDTWVFGMTVVNSSIK
jgi:hypothetical protein